MLDFELTAAADELATQPSNSLDRAARTVSPDTRRQDAALAPAGSLLNFIMQAEVKLRSA